MIERISTPKVGDGLRASWGASVASAINRLAETALKEEMLPNQRNRRGGEGGAAVPGPFEPAFSKNESGNSVITAVGPGFVPWGRRFYSINPTIDGNIIGGVVGIKITHPTKTSDIQAKIVVLPNNSDGTWRTITNSGEETTLPLYFVEDGAIKVDLRCYLALAIRE